MISSGVGLFSGFSPGYAWARMLVRVAPGLMLLERTGATVSTSSASVCIRPSVANFETP